MKFQCWVINMTLPLHRCMKHCVLISAFRLSEEKKSTCNSGRIRTQNLLLTSADALTSRSPSLCRFCCRRISATRSYHSCDLVAGMDFAQCNKVVSFYKVLEWTRKTYGRRYDVVALNCFNVCKFMHYCTYDLVALFLIWPCCTDATLWRSFMSFILPSLKCQHFFI